MTKRKDDAKVAGAPPGPYRVEPPSPDAYIPFHHVAGPDGTLAGHPEPTLARIEVYNLNRAWRLGWKAGNEAKP